MPKQIQTPSASQGLVRMFALKGRYQPVLDETIVPVVVVPLEAPSTRRLAAWGTTAAAAGVGNQNNAWLRNPTNSGHLIVVTAFWGWYSADPTDIYVPNFEVEGGVVGIGSFRDSRITGAAAGGVAARTSTAAAAARVLSFPQYVADQRRYDSEWVIAPGLQLRFNQENSNEPFDMNWEWYEVPLKGGNAL